MALDGFWCVLRVREEPLTLFFLKPSKVYWAGFVCLRLLWFTFQCVYTYMPSICNWLVNYDTFYITGRSFLKMKMGGWNVWKATCCNSQISWRNIISKLLTFDLIFVWSIEHINTKKLCSCVKTKWAEALQTSLNPIFHLTYYLCLLRIKRSVSDIHSFNLKWPYVILTFQVQIRWYGITNF